MIKTWTQLFIRQGFMVREIDRGLIIDCLGETERNMDFLLTSLQRLDIGYTYESGHLTMKQPAITEAQWLQAVDYKRRGYGEGLWFRPGGRKSQKWRNWTHT